MMRDVIFYHTLTSSCGPPASEHPSSQCIWKHKNDDWTSWQLFANSQSNEKRSVHEVDFLSPERSSRERGESKSKDGANISFQWGCQDPFLVAVDRLVHEPEGNKSIYKPTTCCVLHWAQALLCSGKPKCMLMVSKQLHPRSPHICFISKEDSKRDINFGFSLSPSNQETLVGKRMSPCHV